MHPMCQDGVVVRVLDLVLGDLGLNPYSAMEVHWVDLGLASLSV